MRNSKSDSFLLEFSAKLKQRDRLPKNIEVCNLQSGVMASVFETVPAGIINESVFCGMDPDPATAVLKGLVEMIERQAYAEGHRQGLSSCQTKRSDGFAAFPIGISQNEKQIARDNALSEAVERFVWASWWDNPKVGHSWRSVDLNHLSAGESPLLDLDESLNIESVVEVRPKMNGDLVVILYFAFLNPTGVISGGACGNSRDIETIKYRALSELLRHGLAIRKLREVNSRSESFYEQRLAFFGLTPEGTRLAVERLEKSGSESIDLPSLKFDAEIPHALSDLVSVHRCYFENQPEFIGGKLERLCL